MNTNLWPRGILILMVLFFRLSLSYGLVKNSQADTIKVIVTNNTDILDGNTLNVVNLINNPGIDGISFREAIYACNGTLGPKIINFSPLLSGDTITISGMSNDVLRLSSGDLTIDGDINRDGNPDITIDGSLGYIGIPSGFGLCILSSGNTIKGLNFYDFDNSAIMFGCPDALCGSKLFANNSIIKNTISSLRGSGIWVASLGLRPGEEAPQFSDITWDGIIIKGNSIATKAQAIYMCPAVSGGDRDRMLNVTVTENNLSTQASNFTTLDIIVADVNSHYFHLPGPTNYSDSSLFDNLIITKNIIESPNSSGIHLVCANYGNGNNVLQNVKISENTIQNIKITGISITVGNDDGNMDMPTDSNLVSHVEITQNTITNTWQGISISGGSPGSGVGDNFNRVENVYISNNQISDYTDTGISLMGGVSVSAGVSDNILDTIIISDNEIYQTLNPGYGFGIKIQGAVSYTGLPQRNLIKGLHISNNSISKNFKGLQILGGDGNGSKDNQIMLDEFQGNSLLDNMVPSEFLNNTNGATNNLITPAIPMITGTSSNSRCGSGSVVLGAMSSAGLINWYSESAGGTSLGSGMNFTTPGLNSTTIYYVDATSIGCTTPTRTAVIATVLDTNLCQTDKIDFTFSDKIMVYPNPTQDKFEVSLPEPLNIDYKIKVYNSFGVLMKNIRVNKNDSITSIDVSKFPAGIYLIKIESQTGNYFQRVIRK